MNTVKISVIIPVYNCENYLNKCLESIINQSIEEIEIICINDCSTDNSLAILENFKNKDQRIKIINFDKNSKQGTARNAGLKIAKGKFVTFIDADDYADTDLLKKMYIAAEKNYCDVVITNIENYTIDTQDPNLCDLKYKLDTVYKKLALNTGFYFYDFLTYNDLRIGPVAKLYKKSIIDENNIKFPENIIREDEAFYWCFMPFVHNLYFINECLYKRLIHKNSTMYNLEYNFEDINIQIKNLKYIYKYLKKSNNYNLYKDKFINYIIKIISNKSNKQQKEFYTKFFLIMPEIIKPWIIEKKIELNLLTKIFFNRRKIFLWGASIYIENFIKKYNINTNKILGIIDKNNEHWNNKLQGYTIFSPEHLKTQENVDVLLTVKNNNHKIYPLIKKEIDDLKNNGINLLPNFFIDTIIEKKITTTKRLTPKKYLTNIEYHLSEYCNMSCLGCTHFSPLAEKTLANLENFNNDIKRLAFLSNKKIKRLVLLGGEPLLNPEIIYFLKSAREHLPNTRISILTNGILLDKQTEDFWQACKKYNIVINLTKYPIKLDFNKIENIAKSYDVEYGYFNNDPNFIKTSDFYPLDILGKQNIKDSFTNCMMANHCIFLKQGRLYTCATAANIEHFNKFFNKNLKITKNDSIDIYKTKTMKDILKFLAKPIPFCKYCNVKERIFGQREWKQGKKDISEWTN